MNKKSILYGLIVLLTLFLTLGVVSANDNFANETISISADASVSETVLEASNDDIQLESDDFLGSNADSNSDVDLLSANEGTFTELRQKINSASGTLKLDKDYSYNAGSSTDYITVSKNLVIDGQGHTIDGKGVSAIFKLTGSVTLKNLNIINAYHTNTGSAIYVVGSNCLVDNCTISNCSANGNYGGSISWGGPYGRLINSKFFSNHANQRGGAIYWFGNQGTLQNLLIVNNSASNVGGGLYIDNQSPSWKNTQCYNLTFIGNTAYAGGGAVIDQIGSKISYSTFINNHAYYGGGAVIEQNSDGTTVIDHCLIVNNTANIYGGGANVNFGTISNSIVENNTAYVGGGIYATKGEIINVSSSNNLAVYGLNLAVINQVTLIQSYITETYYFNITKYYTATDFSTNIITLPNGDYGYCIEKYSNPPSYGYYNPSVDMIRNTLTGENVGEYIKILVYENVNSKSSSVSKNLYEQIWIFVEEDFRQSSDPLVQKAVYLYDTGFRVPTVNATKILSDGTTLRYDFFTIISANARQNIFYFTITQSGKTDLVPNLDVQKITINKTVNVGEQTSFEIIVKNTGTMDLNNVKIIEELYDGLTYSSWDLNPLWTQSKVNGKYVWTFNPTLRKGMNASFVITFNTTKPGNFTNYVSASSDKTKDKPANNTTEVIDKPEYHPGINVTKKSLTPTVKVGEQTLFLITVWNTGDVALGNVTVKEEYPAGLVYAGFTGVDWVKDGDVFKYLGVLGVGESVSFTIAFNTTVNGTFVNVVVAGSNETENKTTNNTTTVYNPQLDVEKITLTPVVLVGDLTSFDIVVRNTGDVALGNVAVKEDYPVDLVYDSFVGVDWVKDGDVFKYLGVLGVGESVSFTIVFNTTKRGNFTNVVTVSSNETEDKTTNNTTEVLVPGMDVNKVSLTPSVKVGQQTLFLITVVNTGDVALGNVAVKEDYPAGLVYAGFTGVDWVKDGNVFKYVGVLGVGESASFIIAFNTSVNGTFVNVVVAGSNETENKTTNNTTTVYNPQLDVEKITLTPVVFVGNQTSFDIIVKNTGDVALGDVVVAEQIPEGLVFAGFTGVNWYRAGNNFYYNGILNVGQSASFTIVFNTTKPGNFTNVVVARSNETEDKTTNNTTEVINKSEKYPGMDVNKVSLTPTVKVGQQTLFLITVWNTGDVALGNVYVTEEIPDGLTFADYSDKSLWRKDGNTFHYLGVLDVGESASFTIAFNTHMNGTFVNCVVAGSNETDEKPANNTTEVVESDFVIEKITLTPIVKVGEQVVFEINVRNTGSTRLNNVFVEEYSYTGLTYDSFKNNNLWTHSVVNGKNIWTLNKVLELNEVVSLFVYFNTTEKGNFTNVVVGGSDETDNKTTNNTTTVLKPEIDVEKITLTPIVPVGNQTSFEIIVKNIGETPLTKVVLEETSYEGLTYDSFKNSDLWTHSVVNGKNIWTLNKVLQVNEIETLVVYFNTTKAGNFTNVVTVKSNDTEDKIANNTTKVVESDFVIEKITLTPVVKVGDQVKFQIIVRNTGESVLNNVFVEESSYTGLTYVSFIDEGYWAHSVVNGKNIWTLNSQLSVNEVIGFIVVFNTTEKGNFTNVVVGGSDETDNKTTNNTTTVLKPEIDVEKITLTPIVHVGNQTSFEIIVKNIGETPLTNVVLEETSYDGLTYDSFKNNDLWTHSLVNGKNIWTLNKVLQIHEAVSLFVTFNTHTVGNFTNIVTVSSSETDNKIANNTTIVYNETTPIPESNGTKNPNIDLEKIALNKLVIVGNTGTFEIVVKNTGDVNLYDVTVSEDSFEGLKYIKWYDNTGLWIKNNDLTWTMISPLYAGESAAFYVVFNTTTPGEFINIISVSSNETPEKTANDTIQVIKPELDIQKIAISQVVKLGDQAMFEILVHNTGKVVLNNVVVSEDSFEGLIYDSFIDYTKLWTKNNDLSWTLNIPLGIGEYAGFFVVFNTTTTGKFMNIVTVSSDETPNKTDNDTVEVLKSDIHVEKITLTPIVHVGNQTSFEIIVKNIGETPLTNVVLEETSYDGLTFDSFVNNGYWTHSVVNGKNIWTLNKVLQVQEAVPLLVYFNTTSVGNFTNIVTVRSSETEDKIANNTTIVYNTTTPTHEEEPSYNPNITIEKIALQKVVLLGSKVTFEIVVTNTGDVVLHDVVVSEDSFEGLKYYNWYDNTGLWTKNSDLSWKLNSPLYTGEIASFYVVFETTATGKFTNIVSVTSNETDKKTDNDDVEVIKPDFAVEKITINRSVMVGDQVMFEIVVHNFGQTSLNNVVVKESSFEGLVYDSFVDYTNLWTKNSDLSWTFNTSLQPGEYAGFFVIFNTTKAGNFINVVVADSNEISNKTANDTVEVLTAELDIQKITINRTVYVGEQVMFEIIVHNPGKVVLNDVTIHENSFDGLVYNSFSDPLNLWTKNSDLSWTLNTPLYAGEYLSLFVIFNTTKAGKFTNYVSASSDKTPVEYANNVTEVIEKATPVSEPEPETPVADLAIVKVVYSTEGNVVTWGLYVVNNGPDKAVNARVIDVLPDTLKYISSVTSKGSYDVNTGIWTIGDMENGEEAVMIIQTIVLIDNCEIINEARVTSDTFDSNLTNNYDNASVFVEEIPEDVPEETPQQQDKSVDVTPATGNPLIMVLLALIALGCGALRRRK